MNAALCMLCGLLFAFFLQDAPHGDTGGPATDTSATVVQTPSNVSETAPPTISDSDKYSRGAAIAFTGMTIVAFALLLIIGFISSLPKVLAVVEEYFPEPPDHHARPKSHPESQVADDEAVLAAIGYVMHSRLGKDS